MAVEMRAVLANKLQSLMESDRRIVVIDADLARANGTLGIRKQFPDRAFDVGVAEANMASIAAGMASYGFIPFIGSFATFASRRICDQLMISVAYAKQNVKIIGSDPGVSAELNGGTHMALEDVGVLRSIPTMVIFEPVDAVQLEQSVEQIIAHEGPVYIRLFRKPIADVFGPDYRFDLFTADTVRTGKDVTIFASGLMVHEALEAVSILSAEGIDAELINVHTIKPIDEEAVCRSVAKTGCAVTAENHNIIGGLFSAVSETLARRVPVPVVPVGAKDRFGEVGMMPYLKEALGMTAADIVKAAKEATASKA